MSGYRAAFISMALVVSLTSAVWGVRAAESDGEPFDSVELFLGETRAGGSSGFSVGMSYERRLTPLLGIGGFVERAGGDIDATAVAANVVFHPHAGWVVKLSPGVEFESGDAKPLFRIGAAYDFEVAPDWFLSPEVNVKLVEGEKQVIYGLSIGHDF